MYQAFNPKTRKTSLTNDVTFLGKSFGKWNKVKNLSIVLMSYEGLDDEDVKMVLGDNEINDINYNVVSNHEEEENIFKEQIECKIEVTFKITLNPKAVRAIKNCKYCIMKMPLRLLSKMSKRSHQRKFEFLIVLAIIVLVAGDTMLMEDEPHMFNKA